MVSLSHEDLQLIYVLVALVIILFVSHSLFGSRDCFGCNGTGKIGSLRCPRCNGKGKQ